jgi:hypothetical protein
MSRIYTPVGQDFPKDGKTPNYSLHGKLYHETPIMTRVSAPRFQLIESGLYFG